MKKSLHLLLFLFCTVVTLSQAQQVPQGMKYQAVARSLSGQVMANQPVTLKINLNSNLLGSTKIHYSETHTVTTNTLGLFDLTIGAGKVGAGTFKNVPWSSEDIWMEIAIQDGGKSGFSTVSNSRLLAVPYAFHAMTANELASNPRARAAAGGPTDGVPSNVWSTFGNTKTNPSTDRMGTMDYVDLIFVTNKTERLRITKDGDINIANSLKVGKDVEVGNNLTVKNDVFLNTTGGATINNGPLTVANSKPTILTGTLNVDGNTTLKGLTNSTNTTESTNTTTGAVVVAGGVGIGKRINVGGAAQFNNTLGVDGATDLNSTLNVDGGTSLQSTLNVVGVTTLNNALNANGQVTIEKTGTGLDSDYNAYPLRVQGSNQGIAIKVIGTRSTSNNFVTFMDANGIKGRIEGQTLGELQNSTEYKIQTALFALEVAALTADGIGLVAEGAALAAAVITAPAAAGVATQAAALVAKGISLGLEIDKWKSDVETNAGVAYESGNGDYAEWLERGKGEADMVFGQIVGVSGGKLSLRTDQADHYMVVSKRPIVLGNMPAANREKDYEKVAFMGQVPVRVVGQVAIGDYIIPSGNHDGMGIAVHPADMKLGDYSRIVGVAWQAAKDASLNVVNVAVGINTNDLTTKMVAMSQQLESLSRKTDDILAFLQGKAPLQTGNVVAQQTVKPGTMTTSARTETTLTKTVSDVDFDRTVDQKAAQVIKYFGVAKEQLIAKGIDVNANAEMVQFFSDPIASVKQLRRDPIMNTQWGRFDQQLEKKTDK